MDYFVVFLAAGAAWLFGAVWSMVMARPWMAASGLGEADMERKNPLPFLLSFVFLAVIAGAMRHIFILAGTETALGGFWMGLELGLFLVMPWLVTNYMFAKRPINLALLDGINAAGGCTIIGVVLTVF